MRTVITLRMSTETAVQYFTKLGASVVGADRLHASNTNFTDADSHYLLELPDLIHLVANGTRITDIALIQIGTLTQLEMLDLSETAICDAIIPILNSLSQIRVLGLYSTQITDSTMAAIGALPKLEMLNVSFNPQITDAGFNHLLNTNHLKSVEIHGTKISNHAVNEFSIQCPDVIVVTDAGVVHGNA